MPVYYHSGDGARRTAPVSVTLMTVDYLGMCVFLGLGRLEEKKKITIFRNFLSLKLYEKIIMTSGKEKKSSYPVTSALWKKS